jgi:thiol-disulfide isomerase/thioredoxin
MGPNLSVSRRKALAAVGYCLAGAVPDFAIDYHEDIVKFRATTLDGETITTDSVHGKVVLVQFWATWCPYCRADAPFVDKLAREFRDQGLEVLAVDIGESKKTVTKFLAQNPRECKIVLMEDTNLAAWFSPHSFPHYVAIDRACGAAGEQKGAGGERSLRHLLREAGIKMADSGSGGELHSSPRRS